MTTEGNDHYFSATPSSDSRRDVVTVRLAGHDVRVETAGGVFSSGHVDKGTQALLAEVPQLPVVGTFLDLGCGWGPLALSMGLESPKAAVWAIDVNERSRDLTATNARNLGLTGIRVATPDDVPADLVFDVIWSNPPIRIGKSELHALLTRWLHRLAAGGVAWLVVAKQLGAPSLLTWLAGTLGGDYAVTRHAINRGFHIIRVERCDI